MTTRTVRPVRVMGRFSGVVLRQIVRDRTTLFFMLVLPIAIIVIIGTTFGTGGSLTVGVVGGGTSRAGAELVVAMDDAEGVEVRSYDTVEELRQAVRRFVVGAGVVLPADLDDALRTGSAQIRFITDPAQSDGQLARDVFVAAAAGVFGPSDAARFAAERVGVPYDEALLAAGELEDALAPASVETVDVGDRREAELSPFSLTAPQNLVLFVFINGMASGASLVRMRRTGVLRRVLAGPVGAGTITLGLATAWFAIALLQTLLIITVGALAFGVDWGDPLGAGLLAVAFALVGAGAGLLVGALGGDEDRVGAITPPIGIALGALGGCMIPLEVFPATMRSVARLVPHFWAMTAWQELIFDGAGAADIVVPLLVLFLFAILLLVAAAQALRPRLVGD